MKLTFLGTRGGIKAHSEYHNKHSVLMISYNQVNITIDCGADWLNNIPKTDAIFITHAHSDHVGGLALDVPYPVWATDATFNKIKNYPILKKNTIIPEVPILIGDITITAFEVWHSINAPAVGYSITAGDKTIFYVSDLAKIKNKGKALKKVDVYIGDGAIITRKMLLRKKDNVLIGHAPIAMQADWCQKHSIPKFIVTHCGSEIVKHDLDFVRSKLQNIANHFNVEIILAYDGLIVNV